MEITLTKKLTVQAKTLYVRACVRHWEDTMVNDVEDTDGTLIPCRDGELWAPVIDIDKGIILNWGKGKRADVHYKVCDNGLYLVKDEDEIIVCEKDGYVPEIMSPGGDGYGDYIIMTVDKEGYIEDWDAELIREFEQE